MLALYLWLLMALLQTWQTNMSTVATRLSEDTKLIGGSSTANKV